MCSFYTALMAGEVWKVINRKFIKFVWVIPVIHFRPDTQVKIIKLKISPNDTMIEVIFDNCYPY